MIKLDEKTVPVKTIYEMTEEELEKEYQELQILNRETNEFLQRMMEKYLHASK